MSQKPVIENRRIDEGHPFYRGASKAGVVGTGNVCEILVPENSIVKLQGLQITADTNQTITAVYADVQDVDHLMLPAQSGGGDIDWSFVSSAGKNCEDIYGNVFLSKKLIVVFTQATSPQTLTAAIYGARYPVRK